MTRREFSIALAGSVAIPGFPSRVVTFRAIAGVHLPETLTIATNSPEEIGDGVWELRTYRAAWPSLANHFAAVFPRAGIHPFLQRTEGADLTYLIPFENLTARDRAWTTLTADPAWIPLRHAFHSYGLGLYRRESGDRASAGLWRSSPSR
jgi:hypothetical protein